MPDAYNTPLVIGAALSAAAALLHLACILGGAPWYRFLGAGERMARAAAARSLYPAVVTSGIALVLFAWAAYALSAAAVLPALPLLKLGIVTITVVYLLRGLVLLPVLIIAPAKATPFVVWSSLICLAYGTVHLLGVVQVWQRL